MKKHRGLTLVELLVYALILILILGAVYACYSIARDYYNAAQIETQAQQSALTANLAVTRELHGASKDSVVLESAPPSILFLSAKTDEGPFQHDENTGELLWQRWVCLYLDANDSQLKRVELPLTTPVAEVPTNSPSVDDLLLDGNLARKVLANNVSDFKRTHNGASVWFEVTSSLSPTRMPSGQSLRPGQDATTQIVLATELSLRQ